MTYYRHTDRLLPLFIFSVLSTQLVLGDISGNSGLIAQRTPTTTERPPVTLDDPRLTEAPGASLVRDLAPLRAAEAEEVDRSLALTLFAEGRLLFQREAYGPALKRYQRAIQWNPNSSTILEEIVPLAFHLKDVHTGTRYAVLAAERNPGQTELVEPVIAYLADEQEYERAYRLKRQGLELGEHDRRSAEWVEHQFELGRLAFLAELVQEASDAFAVVDDAIQKPSDFRIEQAAIEGLMKNEEMLLTLMAEAFLRGERYDRAERLYRRIQEIAPNENAHRIRQADLAHRRGDNDRALTELQAYLDANATEAGTQAYDLLRDVLRDKGLLGDKSRGFAARLEKAGLAGPPNPVMTFSLAEFHREEQRFDQALPLYQVSIDEAPTVEAYRGAFDCCNRLNDVAAFWELLGTFVDGGRDWEEVEDSKTPLAKNATLMSSIFTKLDKAIEQNQVGRGRITPAHCFGTARMAAHAKELDRAEKYYQEAVTRGGEDHPEWTLSAGLEFYLLGHYDPAIKWLRRAFEQAPAEERPNLSPTLANALAFNKQTDEAVDVLESSLEASKYPLLLKARQAWIRYHGRQYELAEQQCQQLLKEYDHILDDPLIREGLKDVRSTLSNLAVEAKDVSQAAEWLQQILDEFPEDAGAMNDLGYLWADANQHLHRSLRMVQYAVEKHPENYAYLDSLGWTLYRLGRFADAAAALEKAVELGTPEVDGIILEHLGDTYQQLNRPADARRSWEAAREAFRAADEGDKLRELESKLKAHAS